MYQAERRINILLLLQIDNTSRSILTILNHFRKQESKGAQIDLKKSHTKHCVIRIKAIYQSSYLIQYYICHLPLLYLYLMVYLRYYWRIFLPQPLILTPYWTLDDVLIFEKGAWPQITQSIMIEVRLQYVLVLLPVCSWPSHSLVTTVQCTLLVLLR